MGVLYAVLYAHKASSSFADQSLRFAAHSLFFTRFISPLYLMLPLDHFFENGKIYLPYVECHT